MDVTLQKQRVGHFGGTNEIHPHPLTTALCDTPLFLSSWLHKYVGFTIERYTPKINVSSV